MLFVVPQTEQVRTIQTPWAVVAIMPPSKKDHIRNESITHKS